MKNKAGTGENLGENIKYGNLLGGLVVAGNKVEKKGENAFMVSRFFQED